MIALGARGVCKRYRAAVAALDGVDLEVAAGERVALVGESGSGKSTLLRCFNRMVAPDAGVVSVDGVDVAALEPVALRRRLGYVQQDGGLLPHWTVARNVALVPRLRGQPDAGTRADRALERVGLSPVDFGPRWPRQLSGGQRQRVALARAIAAGEPPLTLLLDEPFGALDAITRAEMQEAFLDLCRQLQLTVLLVTHDLREAFLLAHRVVVLRAGRVERAATPAQIRAEPGSPWVERLLQRAGLIASPGSTP